LSSARSLSLSPSRILAGLIVGAHLCAASAALLCFPGWPGGLLAAALVALGATAAWNRALLRARHSMRVIRLEPGKAVVDLAGGASFPLEPGGHVNRFMVTLALRAPARRTLLVTADMLDPESFRVLRLWALWGKVPGVAGKQLLA